MKKTIKIGMAFAILLFAFSSCVNLKEVNDYSTASATSLKKIEEVKYSFTKHCLDRCEFESLRNFDITKGCNCDFYQKADSVTIKIYNLVHGYFNSLTKLSDNELTEYKFEDLNNAISKGDFGGIEIKDEHVTASSNIGNIILRAVTDSYRKKKIKEYVSRANDDILILVTILQDILGKNLYGELEFKKTKNYAYHKERLLEGGLTDFENRQLILAYYDELSDINEKQKQLEVLVKSFEKVKTGHQKLYDNLDDLTNKELKEVLIGYASSIKDIISEFNKLKD